MSEGVLQAIAQATLGYVEAPAGCGKTEAIVNAVGRYTEGRQLILTHTHAGVDALRQRFRRNKVPSSKFHVDTIAGWAWGWVRRYPEHSKYGSPTDIAKWDEVYPAMLHLLDNGFVQDGILNSYTGVIVDEYQDCTKSMHGTIMGLAKLLPCRVLGDELQGIFDFHEPLVVWNDIREAFKDKLGTLEEPHRWIKAGNKPLGEWLLGARASFLNEQEPSYHRSALNYMQVPANDVSRQLLSLVYELQGRVCVIGPKARPIGKGLETALVRNKFCVVEPNELSVLQSLILALSQGNQRIKATALIKFVDRVFGGVPPDDKTFLTKLIKGQKQRPQRADRKVLCARNTAGVNASLIGPCRNVLQAAGLGERAEMHIGIARKYRRGHKLLICG